MTLRTAAAALAAIALFALPTSVSAKSSKPAVREFTGTVSSASAKSFKLRRPGRAAVVVRVSRKTRVARGAKPRKGRKLVVKARRHGRAWLARSVRLVPVPAGEEVDGGEQPGDGVIEDQPDPDEEPDSLGSNPELELEGLFDGG